MAEYQMIFRGAYSYWKRQDMHVNNKNTREKLGIAGKDVEK